MDRERIQRAQQIMRDEHVAALLVGPSADLWYLTGYHALPLERLTLLVVPATGEPTLIVPELELARADAFGVSDQLRVVAFDETHDPVPEIARSLVDGAGPSLRIAVQDRLWTAFTLRLQAAMPAATWIPGSQVMQRLRIIKTQEEIDALRGAAKAIDAVHAQIPDLLRAGRTEAEVGRDLAELILVDHDEVNFVIVASGPNGASPHHETSARTIEEGDVVVVDIGGTRNGYCSDMTRNYAVGHVPEGYAQLHRVLEEAQHAACEAVAAGVRAETVDAAARDHITAAGYGQWFIHRTGHGIGVEEHEEPWIVAGNTQILDIGMAFSVEPGIYLPGRYGARIEDIVVVTADGVDRLNRQPREVVVCG